jgi:hypothetical protein
VKTTKITKKVHSFTVKLGQHSKTTKSSSKSGSNMNGVKGQFTKTKVSLARGTNRPIMEVTNTSKQEKDASAVAKKWECVSVIDQSQRKKAFKQNKDHQLISELNTALSFSAATFLQEVCSTLFNYSMSQRTH